MLMSSLPVYSLMKSGRSKYRFFQISALTHLPVAVHDIYKYHNSALKPLVLEILSLIQTLFLSSGNCPFVLKISCKESLISTWLHMDQVSWCLKKNKIKNALFIKGTCRVFELNLRNINYT